MQNESDADEMSIRSFRAGGRVRETGLAVVHKDEVVLPAPGSEAVIEPVMAGESVVINYYFPVEIVVVGDLQEEHHRAIESRICRRLCEAME